MEAHSSDFDSEYDENFDDDEDTQKDRYISFLIAEEEYAIPIQYINEIIGMQKFTPLPETESYISGIIKLRNSVYPVIDMRKRFGLPEVEYGNRTCIIIVILNEMSIGLIVDSVNEVMDIPEEEITTSIKGTNNKFIKGIGKVGDKVEIVLDVEQMFNATERDKLSAVVA
ncbi:MAG: chemotaxis protein CheW [Candidatus Kapabacteria bacterium]|nr:chemotaxis protein CheW [Candidatus Kapabacteria bacterium]